MTLRHSFSRSRVAALASIALLAVLAGCGGGSSGSGSTVTPSGGGTGDYNSVVITSSATGTVSVGLGGSQTVTLAFTASDGKAITALSVTSGLSDLPAGWTGPASFSCASVTTGNGCVLSLTYRPTVAGTGNLTLPIQYTTNAGSAASTAVTVSFQAEAVNHVVGTVSPAGQIDEVVGGSIPLPVTFTTDDGTPATHFQVTSSLTALPSGWSASAATLACASVSSGNGCQIVLTYAPTAGDAGTLTITFSYVNNAGATVTGAVPVNYIATSNETVQATASPTGIVNAFVGTGSQPVHLVFAPVGGSQATSLQVTTPLNALPAGWSAPSAGFSCATVTSGNGCDLVLTFAPQAVMSGSLSLAYQYVDNAGTSKQGTAVVRYASTAHNNVVGTVSPSGTVAGVVAGSQAVTVTFTTDDGSAASQFAITSGLNALPAGWSATQSAVSCSSVRTGNTCQLSLTFAPTTQVAGSLQLGYGYTDDAGTPRTGTVSIPYLTQTNDTVVATNSPAGQVTVAPGGTPQSVTVTLTTNDGAVATNLSFAQSLASLPSGWTASAATPTCAQVSVGTSCQLTLTYAPTGTDRGVLTLPYGYTNNAGIAQTGTVSVPYQTAVQHLYVIQPSSGIYLCSLASDGTPSGCALTGGLPYAYRMVIVGSTAYVRNNFTLWACAVATDGTLNGCADTGVAMTDPTDLTVANGYLYLSGGVLHQPQAPAVAQALVKCALLPDNSLGTCSNEVAADPTGAWSADGSAGVWSTAITGGHAYLASRTGMRMCSVDGQGDLSNCVASSWTDDMVATVAASGVLYFLDDSISAVIGCQAAVDGTLGPCFASSMGTWPEGIVVTSTQAYVGDAYGNLFVCNVGWGASAGALGPCVRNTVGQSNYGIAGIVLH